MHLWQVKREVVELININPNVVQEAKTALAKRYNMDQRNGSLNNAINESGEAGKANVESKVQESITTKKQERRDYLQTL